MGEDLARQLGMLFIECSAKTKEGIDQAFDEVAHKVSLAKIETLIA